MGSHAAVAAELGREKYDDPEVVSKVLLDIESSPLGEKEKALLRYVQKLNADPAGISAGDVETLKKIGWSESAIYDALTVAALFRFYNTWNDGAGTGDMSAAEFRESGRRLADRGYRMMSLIHNLFGELKAALKKEAK